MEDALANKPNKKAKAHMGEDEACAYITKLGYKIIKRNFNYGRVGEIDIVAKDGEMLVFIEVKYREDYSHGTPEESVDWRKQAQLKKVARMYYYVNELQDQDCRFDVIAVDALFGKTEIRHHINAFI
jgi:putative endonuclease